MKNVQRLGGFFLFRNFFEFRDFNCFWLIEIDLGFFFVHVSFLNFDILVHPIVSALDLNFLFFGNEFNGVWCVWFSMVFLWFCTVIMLLLEVLDDIIEGFEVDWDREEQNLERDSHGRLSKSFLRLI